MTIYYINPHGSMDQLSQVEVSLLTAEARSSLYQLYRNCSLTVLNSGAITDDSRSLLNSYSDFDIKFVTNERGITLELHNPPTTAFVDDKIIRNIQYHLFAVLRDIIFVNVITKRLNLDLQHNSQNITNLVFSILRNARTMIAGEHPNLVVCWGGHSITPTEYQYCRTVGLALGLRELNIVTGCGAGVMEAPMRGAAIGHAHQRYKNGRFIGITEPSIIVSEPPNPIVNELIIMPDIEKRLEAFVRLGHAIIIFPGGPGTFEELLYILGIKMHPGNLNQPLPLILTGSKESQNYFATIENFIIDVFGEEVRSLFEIIIDDPELVAKKLKDAMKQVQEYRYQKKASYNFNWSLKIDEELQRPFIPNHNNMANLNLHFNQPTMHLIANLRRAFSGIVAGNIKPNSIELIEKVGKFKLQGDKKLMEKIDRLLQDFIQQDRMKLPNGNVYEPCYEIIR